MKKSMKTVLAACLCFVFLSGCGKESEADAYVEQGMEALAREDFDGARAALLEAEKHSPEDAGVLRAMGIVYYEEENYKEALDYFNRALSALEEGKEQAVREDILNYKADAELRSGAYEEARADYSQLISLDNESAEYYLLRGKAGLELGNAEEAVQDFRMAASAANGNPDYCEDIYLTLKEHGAWEAGMEFLNEILAAGPKGEEDKGRYGRVCLEAVLFRTESGRYEEALSLIGEALPQVEEPVKKELLYAEAVCFEQLLNFEAALEKFWAYRESYGADEVLEHEIAFLETRVGSPEGTDAQAVHDGGL